jgi:antitoxin component HigA of HigAB toxin-antitoxin module
MAISGKFLADFESFYTACTKAEGSLRSFESGAGKVETSLNKMVDSFSGRKLIQDATLMTEAVNRIGGTSKLTEAELARVGATATEAVAKMKALGIEIPPAVQKLASSVQQARSDLTDMEGSAIRTGRATQGLGDQLAQVDGVLGTFGVHLGPEVKALRELGEHSDKTASELGALGTVALAAGAAIGGWKLGRLIADFTGSDEAIGNATAKLLGWTTAVGGAGSATDTLARASATAGRNIVSMAEALQINTDAVHKWQGEISRAHAAEDSAKEVAHWRAELQALGGGILSSLTKDLDSHNFSQAELARRYGVSTEALGVLSRQMQRHKEVMAEVKAEQEKFAALQDHLFGHDLTMKAQEYAHAIGDVGNASRLLPPVAAEVNAVMKSAYDVLVKAGLGASETATQFRELAIATTDWAAINAKLAAMPDPFAAQIKARSAAYRQTLVDQANLNQGITDSQLYWAHAGEIADESMKKAASAVENVTATVDNATSAVGRLQQGFFSLGPSNVDSLNADAEKNLRRGGIASTVGLLQRQAATRIANGLQSFDKGGPVTQDGPIYAHAGEYVMPKGAVGGVMVTIAPGAVVIQGGGANSGREAADALLARLKSRGVRV